jgi:exo-beta-1,3-glucanase (GH17 family)
MPFTCRPPGFAPSRAALAALVLLASTTLAAADAAAALAVSASTIAFDSRAVGGVSAATSVTLTNTGRTPLVMGAATLDGPGARHFQIAPGDCGATLAAGAACRVAVRFAPAGTGTFKASLRIDAGGAPTRIGLTGSNPLRPLPAIYSTAAAVAYSPYRSCGPPCGEIPTSSEILQDFGLLSKAGFTLLRNYDSGTVGADIITLAAANYPALKFQLGIYFSPTNAECVDPTGNNASQIAEAITLANTYPNTVVTVSVGNETQGSGALPVSCLAGYISEVRAAIKQPVTTDDVASFYSGQLANKPDSILLLVDFVSLHTYPFLENAYWDWQQTQARAGTPRATAMMNAALVQAQDDFLAAYNYVYVGSGGVSVNEGSQLPMVVGETGWKGYETNPADPIEVVANPAIANPVNVKWYLNLLGEWRGAGEGPTAIFLFEAFDESWKGTDDGWGLWLSSRAATYAICGLGGGPACNKSVYKGAGYYHTAKAEAAE